MAKYVAPSMDAWEFTCPLCGTLCRQHWRKLLHDTVTDAPVVDDEAKTVTCSACDEESWWIKGVMVWPRVETSLPAHDEMPDDVRALYNEARSVAVTSPRSAAALLRTALETLVHNHLRQKGKLNDAIGKLVAAGKLDVAMQQTMDLLRLSGNGAVHPNELQNDDTTVEATALFGLLNLVVERLIAQPRQIAAMYDSLPQAKRDQIEERDGSNTTPQGG